MKRKEIIISGLPCIHNYEDYRWQGSNDSEECAAVRDNKLFYYDL